MVEWGTNGPIFNFQKWVAFFVLKSHYNCIKDGEDVVNNASFAKRSAPSFPSIPEWPLTSDQYSFVSTHKSHLNVDKQIHTG